MHGLLLLARFIHILCGVYWIGAVLFINIFLGPAFESTGAAGFAVMKALAQRKYFEFTIGMAALSILAGFYLVWVDSVGFDPVWFRTAFGQAISIGMVAAIVAFFLGVFLVKPALNKMGAIGGQLLQANDQNRPALAAELDAARKRLIAISGAAMLLMVVTVAAMAVARYL